MRGKERSNRMVLMQVEVNGGSAGIRAWWSLTVIPASGVQSQHSYVRPCLKCSPPKTTATKMNLQLKLEGTFFFLERNVRPIIKPSDVLQLFPGSVSRLLRKGMFKALLNDDCNFLVMHGMGATEKRRDW